MNNNETKASNSLSRDYNTTVYVFEQCPQVLGMSEKYPDANADRCSQNEEKSSRFRTLMWQHFPSGCASLSCVTYGLMLGWPSPTYPQLLGDDAPISLDYASMAMVAGFLMLGMCIGTPISSKRTICGPKYGIVLGNGLMVIGWILMWQATNKMGLLASRIILGAGHGYAMGQIKLYIKEMCDNALTLKLTKQINVYMIFGFVMAFAIGSFVPFRTFGFICMIFSTVVFFLEIFLPPTPKELVEAKKMPEAKKLLLFLNPDCDSDEKIRQILENKKQVEKQSGFLKIIKNPTLRNNFFKLTILGFIAQFSGAPATLIFTQLIFENTLVPHPHYVALMYAVLFFLSTILGIYEFSKLNKKSVLLLSSCSISICLVLKILVIYFKLNERFFSHSSVIVIFLFIFFHTIGLGSIPVTLVNDFFPKNYRLFATKYYICLVSMFALISTKIFQILFFDFSIETPFYMFLSVSVLGVFFVSIFVPKHFVPAVEKKELFNVNIVHNSLNESDMKIINK